MERRGETRNSSGGRQHCFARRLSTGLAGTIVIGGAIFMGGAASLVTAFANTGGVTVLETCTTWSVNAHLDSNVHNRLVTVTWPDSTFVINAIYTTDSPPVAVPNLFDRKGSWPDTGTITLTIYLGPLISSGVDTTYTDFITPPENCTSPTISTKLSASSVTLPGTVTDQATLSGETSDAGGTVTYNVYAVCGGASVLPGNTKTVVSGSVPASDAFTLAAGSYEFQAVYSGDAKNALAKSVCGTEPLTVTSGGAGGVLGITTTVPAPTPSTPSTGATGSLTGITVGGFLILGGLCLALVGAIVPRRRSRI